MGFLLLLVALACTLLRLGRTGPYREKHLDLLRIDGTFKSENAETWDFGIPYGPMSQRRRHILTNKSTRGISSIGTIGQVPCGRLPRCSPRAVPRALVVADEAPADDDGDTFFTKVWCGWRRVPIWILDFFSPKSPSHGPKIIQQDQRTHSELVHQSGLRRSCAGLHRLELCFHPWLWLKPEVLNDGRRENNMDFFMKHGIFIMLF